MAVANSEAMQKVVEQVLAAETRSELRLVQDKVDLIKQLERDN